MKKSKKKLNTLGSSIADAWSSGLQRYQNSLYSQICNLKPPTKTQLAKWAKEKKAQEIKDKKRRAKKITMTVGELEDKIEEAEERYRDDY